MDKIQFRSRVSGQRVSHQTNLFAQKAIDTHDYTQLYSAAKIKCRITVGSRVVEVGQEGGQKPDEP